MAMTSGTLGAGVMGPSKKPGALSLSDMLPSASLSGPGLSPAMGSKPKVAAGPKPKKMPATKMPMTDKKTPKSKGPKAPPPV